MPSVEGGSHEGPEATKRRSTLKAWRSDSHPLGGLTEAAEGHLVAPLEATALGGANLVSGVALGAQAAVALASRRQASQLAVLLGGGAQPVDTGVLQGQRGTRRKLVHHALATLFKGAEL